MSYADSEELQYFDLLVECAVKLDQSRPVGEHRASFWQRTVGKAWREVYQHMTRPAPEFGVWKSTQYRREMALRFAALSRLAAMAAWDIANDDREIGEEPGAVRDYFLDAGTQMSPKIR